MAGAEPAVDAVREVREALAGSAPVVLNTGARAGNIAAFAPFIDGVIVGSDLKRDGGTWNPVERERVRRFLDAVAERLSAAMLLGLDLGTTAVKAVVLDPERGLLAATRCPNARPRRSPAGRSRTPARGSTTRSS